MTGIRQSKQVLRFTHVQIMISIYTMNRIYITVHNRSHWWGHRTQCDVCFVRTALLWIPDIDRIMSREVSLKLSDRSEMSQLLRLKYCCVVCQISEQLLTDSSRLPDFAMIGDGMFWHLENRSIVSFRIIQLIWVKINSVYECKEYKQQTMFTQYITLLGMYFSFVGDSGRIITGRGVYYAI